MPNPCEVKTVKCLNCDAVRKQNNHWFTIEAFGESFVCSQYSEGQELGINERTVCGNNCALQVFQRFLNGEIS